MFLANGRAKADHAGCDRPYKSPKGHETGVGGFAMSTPIYIAIGLVVCGAAVTAFAFIRAPRSKDFAGWDVLFMSGIGAIALGFLATLVEVVTG